MSNPVVIVSSLSCTTVGSAFIAAACARLADMGINVELLDAEELAQLVVEHGPTHFPIQLPEPRRAPAEFIPGRRRYNRGANRPYPSPYRK